MRFFLAVALLLAGCDYVPFGYTPIAEIVAAPAQFEGKEVKIKGKVVNATQVPLLEVKIFLLEEGGVSEIAVVTSGTLPALDEQVRVRGVVQSGAIIGGQSIALRVNETKRLPGF